jgi:hypothetical protein
MDPNPKGLKGVGGVTTFEWTAGTQNCQAKFDLFYKQPWQKMFKG